MNVSLKASPRADYKLGPLFRNAECKTPIIKPFSPIEPQKSRENLRTFHSAVEPEQPQWKYLGLGLGVCGFLLALSKVLWRDN